MMSQKGGGDGRGEKWITGIGEKIRERFTVKLSTAITLRILSSFFTMYYFLLFPTFHIAYLLIANYAQKPRHHSFVRLKVTADFHFGFQSFTEYKTNRGKGTQVINVS